jgi:hypothetical protein
VPLQPAAPLPNKHDAPKIIQMAATSVSGNPPTRNINSNELRKPHQAQGGLPEAYADMWRNAEDPHNGAVV